MITDNANQSISYGVDRRDEGAYDGHMCRYTFSKILQNLEAFVWSLYPRDEFEAVDSETRSIPLSGAHGICNDLIREKLQRINAQIAEIHDHYILDDPELAIEEKKPQEATPLAVSGLGENREQFGSKVPYGEHT